jgi:hypothetical protein
VEYTCTSVEMNATSSSIVTDKPSTCCPMPNSVPPDCHHVHWRTTASVSP